MARGEVFIRDENGNVQLWRTDLTGHGNVAVGEEFTIREVSQFGKSTLVKGGRKKLVRVSEIEQSGRHQTLIVDVLKDVLPDSRKQSKLF